MALIETTLSVNYQVNEWGVKQAVREIISNAIDGEERGKPYGTGKMDIKYSKRKKVMTITNAQTRVPTKALLMGTSESRNNDACIGTFGEGLPMALLVMARKGLPVTIFNGNEKWEPQIVHSKTYDAEVLAVRTREMINERHDFTVELGDIEPEEAAEIQGMFLRLDAEYDPDTDMLKSVYSEEGVLVSPRHRGMVYNKGVFVCRRDDLLFGYNLAVRLNRDRSIVDEYDLKYGITGALNTAINAHPGQFAQLVVQGLLDHPNTLENQAQWGALRHNQMFIDSVVAEWQKAYGPKTVAVANAEEARQAELLGLKGIVCPPLLLGIMTDVIGSFSSMKEVLGTQVAETYTTMELTGSEAQAFSMACHRFQDDLAAEGMVLEVARFGLSTTMSSNRPGAVMINRVLLSTPVEVIKAVSLELGKVKAARSGKRAVDEQLDILADLVVG